MINKQRIYLAVFLLITPPVAASEAPDLKSDAASGSQSLGIPEPMVFDLVRPLGSPRGEMEVNALFDRATGNGPLHWAPEFEYAWADGYTMEVELPYENAHLGEFKLALQGTLGELIPGRMIHGWQLIGRKTRHEDSQAADALYLNGARLSDRWSTMNMVGLRRTLMKGDGDWVTLLNTSWFRQINNKLVLGVELNNELYAKGQWQYRLTPQLHYSFSEHKAIQIGVGPSTMNAQKEREWLFGTRLIYSF